MASERGLCNPAEGVDSAAQTAEYLENIITNVSLFGKVAFSHISVHEMEVQA